MKKLDEDGRFEGDSTRADPLSSQRFLPENQLKITQDISSGRRGLQSASSRSSSVPQRFIGRFFPGEYADQASLIPQNFGWPGAYITIHFKVVPLLIEVFRDFEHSLKTCHAMPLASL